MVTDLLTERTDSVALDVPVAMMEMENNEVVYKKLMKRGLLNNILLS